MNGIFVLFSAGDAEGAIRALVPFPPTISPLDSPLPITGILSGGPLSILRPYLSTKKKNKK